MIFVTVGHQMPFDRLIGWMETWSAEHAAEEVAFQVGDGRLPTRGTAHRFLSPKAYRNLIRGADVVVGHAGTGTILECGFQGTPLVVVPRRARQRETRNDHQVATARAFSGRAWIQVADDPASLAAAISALRGQRAAPIGAADSGLLDRIRGFIEGGVIKAR